MKTLILNNSFFCFEDYLKKIINLKVSHISPSHQHIFLTTLCNNNCFFCSRDKNLCEPSLNYIKMKLKKIATDSYGVYLNGGEPTISKNFYRTLFYIKKLKFKEVHLLSNGRMFSYDKFCEVLFNSKIITEFGISLHAHKKELHETLTRAKNSFDQTIKGIDTLVSTKQNISVNCVINKKNYKYLPNIVDLISKHNVSKIQLSFVDPVGNALKYFFKIVPRMKKTIPFIRRAISSAISYNTKILITGVPFCLFVGYEKFVGDLFKPIEKKSDIKSLHHIHRMNKIKLSVCKKCKYELICEGIFKKYVVFYGKKEFQPIKGKKVSNTKEMHY